MNETATAAKSAALAKGKERVAQWHNQFRKKIK